MLSSPTCCLPSIPASFAMVLFLFTASQFCSRVSTRLDKQFNCRRSSLKCYVFSPFYEHDSSTFRLLSFQWALPLCCSSASGARHVCLTAWPAGCRLGIGRACYGKCRRYMRLPAAGTVSTSTWTGPDVTRPWTDSELLSQARPLTSSTTVRNITT